MIVPIEITWVTGQVVTAAQLNSNVRDAINFLLNPPTCELLQTVAQSIPSNGAALLLDTEVLDNDNMHSTVSNTNQMVLQTGGRYRLGGGITISAGTSGRRGGWWRAGAGAITGTQIMFPPTASGEISYPLRERLVFFNAGEVLDLFAFQDSGVAVSTSSAFIQHNSSVSVRYAGNA